MIAGTLINFAAIIVGGTLGTLLGDRMPEKTRQTVLDGLGLVTLVIGITMAVGTKNILIPLFSILIGGMLGEWLRIEERLDRLGHRIEARLGRWSGSGSSSARDRGIAKGFVTASLVFCVGPMAILGAIQDGLMGDYSLLAVKSLLDGFVSMALAASLGAGVILSAVAVFGYQGILSLLAALFGAALGGVTRETPWVVEMTATGGVVILSLGVILLDIKRIRAANLMPAVFVAPAIVLILGLLRISF